MLEYNILFYYFILYRYVHIYTRAYTSYMWRLLLYVCTVYIAYIIIYMCVCVCVYSVHGHRCVRRRRRPLPRRPYGTRVCHRLTMRRAFTRHYRVFVIAHNALLLFVYRSWRPEKRVFAAVPLCPTTSTVFPTR